MTLESLVDAIVTFVRDHEEWTPVVVFLVAFGESFAFLSLIVPGTAILAGVAALLAASGVEMHIVAPAILAAGLGGTLGYAISFWLGRYFKDSVPHIWPFKTRPHLITQGEKFFETYGAFGVFFGHFFGPVRAVIPVVAGMFRMRELPFQIANVASAFVWAAGVIAPAFFLVTFKDEVLGFLAAHHYWVAALLFLLALANSIPRPILFWPTLILVIGLGSMMVLANGHFTSIWLAAAAGAFAGDLYAYYKGVTHKQDRLATWPFSASPEQHTEALALVERHGPLSLIVSKFQGFNRGLVPLEIGILERPFPPFAIQSAASTVAWGLAILLPALIVGLYLA